MVNADGRRKGKPWVNADDGRKASIKRKGKALYCDKKMPEFRRREVARLRERGKPWEFSPIERKGKGNARWWRG